MLVPDLRLHNTQWHEIIGAGETVSTLRVPTSPPGEHGTVCRNPGTWRLPHVYHWAKYSAGFPNSCWKTPTQQRQMHAVLVLFRPLPNVGIQNYGMWGMYTLVKAYRSIQKSITNLRVEDWEASNGRTKDTTRLFHGPWHDPVGEHLRAQPCRMWNRLRFHPFFFASLTNISKTQKRCK